MDDSFTPEEGTQSLAPEFFRNRLSSLENQEPVSIVDRLRKTRKLIRNANEIHREQLTQLDEFAVWITKRVGTMGFFVIVFVWTSTWLLWNTLAPVNARFDPFPAFVLWLFISQVLQLFLMPLIMIGQNLDAKHSEARAEANYEVNIKAEQEVEVILAYQEKQNHMMLELVQQHEAYQEKQNHMTLEMMQQHEAYQEKQSQMMLELMRRHEAYHQQLMEHMGQLDPEMAQRLGLDLRKIGKEMSE